MSYNEMQENFSTYDKLYSAIKNSPDVVIDILFSLGFEIAKEDYTFTVNEPNYEYVEVEKTREVPCGFPCFYRTETYIETEKKIIGYKKVESTKQRYVLKKK